MKSRQKERLNSNFPKVSVITICLNAEKFIERVMESVSNQTYKNIEYLVIDGGSTDGTLKILEKYRDQIDILISEKDNGISDAWNKGIMNSTGEFIQLLNADDILPNNKIEISTRLLIENPSAGFVYGDILLSDHNSSSNIKIRGNPKYSSFIKYMMPKINHPTLLVRRKVYLEHGCFDSIWKIGMDYDWLLRIFKKGVLGIYSPNIYVKMSNVGVSSIDWKTTLSEERDVAIFHGLNHNIGYIIFFVKYIKVRIRIILEKILPKSIIFLFRPGKSYQR